MLRALLEKYLVGRFLSGLAVKVPEAINAHLDLDELLRIAVTTFVTTQDPAAVLPALLANAETIVAPKDVALAKAVLTLAHELLQRFLTPTASQALVAG